MAEIVIGKIENFLKKYGLLDLEKAIILGFSGGEDSSCLLSVLARLSQKYKFKLVCAHLNHNWRGEEALGEQKKCGLIAKKLGVEFYTETLDKNTKCTESAAREARYDFFSRCAEKYNTEVVLTAHTMTDNVETVLYRIIKGTGPYGLCGIPCKRQLENYTVYRPMLDITREEVVEYNKKYVDEKNCDSSNSDTKYARNSIRLEIIPKLMQINPLIERSISDLSALANEEAAIIEEYLGKVKEEISEDGKFLTDKFLKLSPFVQKKLIYEIVRKYKITYDRQDVEDICDFIETNKTSKSGRLTSITSDCWLFVSGKYISVVDEVPEVLDFEPILISSEGTFRACKFELKIEKYKRDGSNRFANSVDTIYADLSETEFPLQFRGRNLNSEKADVIVPFGSKGHQKLKKFLSGKNLNKFEKNNIMLLCKDEEVLWVVGLGISDKIRVKQTPTHKISFKRIEK